MSKSSIHVTWHREESQSTGKGRLVKTLYERVEEEIVTPSFHAVVEHNPPVNGRPTVKKGAQKLTKAGKPDMRFKENREQRDAEMKAQDSMKIDERPTATSSSATDAKQTPKLTKAGKPDMRFKENREKRDAEIKAQDLKINETKRPTEQTPMLAKSGEPGMLFKDSREKRKEAKKVKEVIGTDNNQKADKSRTAEAYPTPRRRKDGKLDMRFKENRHENEDAWSSKKSDVPQTSNVVKSSLNPIFNINIVHQPDSRSTPDRKEKDIPVGPSESTNTELIRTRRHTRVPSFEAPIVKQYHVSEQDYHIMGSSKLEERNNPIHAVDETKTQKSARSADSAYLTLSDGIGQEGSQFRNSLDTVDNTESLRISSVPLQKLKKSSRSLSSEPSTNSRANSITTSQANSSRTVRSNAQRADTIRSSTPEDQSHQRSVQPSLRLGSSRSLSQLSPGKGADTIRSSTPEDQSHQRSVQPSLRLGSSRSLSQLSPGKGADTIRSSTPEDQSHQRSVQPSLRRGSASSLSQLSPGKAAIDHTSSNSQHRMWLDDQEGKLNQLQYQKQPMNVLPAQLSQSDNESEKKINITPNPYDHVYENVNNLNNLSVVGEPEPKTATRSVNGRVNSTRPTSSSSPMHSSDSFAISRMKGVYDQSLTSTHSLRRGDEVSERESSTSSCSNINWYSGSLPTRQSEQHVPRNIPEGYNATGTSRTQQTNDSFDRNVHEAWTKTKHLLKQASTADSGESDVVSHRDEYSEEGNGSMQARYGFNASAKIIEDDRKVSILSSQML